MIVALEATDFSRTDTKILGVKSGGNVFHSAYAPVTGGTVEDSARQVQRPVEMVVGECWVRLQPPPWERWLQ